jgi:hypothetical protein
MGAGTERMGVPEGSSRSQEDVLLNDSLPKKRRLESH